MAVQIDQAKAELMQKQRIARAAEQRDGWEFEYHPAIGKWLLKKSDGSRPYLLTPEACECPDDQVRCRPAGKACKHRVGLALHRLLSEGPQS
jgi:hypothetical protein